MLIDDFILELESAISFEQARITGYSEILAFPASLLSQQSRTEVQEALNWSTDRLNKLTINIGNVKVLRDNQYPERVQQIAPSEVLTELNKALNAMSLAILEFQPPPEVVLDVSPEIPVA